MAVILKNVLGSGEYEYKFCASKLFFQQILRSQLMCTPWTYLVLSELFKIKRDVSSFQKFHLSLYLRDVKQKFPHQQHQNM